MTSRQRILVLAMVIVLTAAGSGLLLRAAQLDHRRSSRNQVLIDAHGTAAVITEVSDDVGKIFTYSPATLETTRSEARQILDGTAATQYAALFTQLETAVPAQQLSLTSKVVRAGVTELSGDDARLLVFINQASVRSGAHGSASTAAAQLSITVRREAGRWRIVSMSSE